MRKLLLILFVVLCGALGFSRGLRAEDPGPLATALRQALIGYGLLTSAGSPAGTFDGEVSGDYFRGSIAAINTLVGIDPDDGSTQTVTLSNDATGSGAISVTNLSASYSRHVLVEITVTGGPHDVDFDGDWRWTNADGEPTSLEDGVHQLWIWSTGSAATNVRATLVTTVAGS